MEDIKCSKCGIDMIHIGGNRWYCPKCESKFSELKVLKMAEPKYIKQEPYIDDTGIWTPVHSYVPEGQASSYQMVISKELFVEAYNKWIKENE